MASSSLKPWLTWRLRSRSVPEEMKAEVGIYCHLLAAAGMTSAVAKISHGNNKKKEDLGDCRDASVGPARAQPGRPDYSRQIISLERNTSVPSLSLPVDGYPGERRRGERIRGERKPIELWPTSTSLVPVEVGGERERGETMRTLRSLADLAKKKSAVLVFTIGQKRRI
ncbi:hypothetical protein EYF80_034020 [Liparis tanakae]|uniref:Uncharacterized protein n=1 Tax=Liparis tanakae TaxID=230148 RepID=A0A4Z2GSS3_9TELE|nr:hypothetical protein EYF80_034020 [Liparis tanakae]